jgi:hypothetical protein
VVRRHEKKGVQKQHTEKREREREMKREHVLLLRTVTMMV